MNELSAAGAPPNTNGTVQTFQKPESKRYRDFDAAVAEAEPITFTVTGKTYSLPPDVPAAVILEEIRNGTGGNDPKAGLRFLEALLGKEALDEMVERGLGLKQLTDLSDWLAEQYGLIPDEAGAKSPPA